MLDGLRLPIFPIPGNHDDRELIRIAFPKIDALSKDGPLSYAIEDWPVRIIALDSSVDGKPYGRLGQAQLDWLAEKLEQDRSKPTLVMLHHPPFKTGIGHMDWSMLRDSDALADIIQKHPRSSVSSAVMCTAPSRPALPAPSLRFRPAPRIRSS